MKSFLRLTMLAVALVAVDGTGHATKLVPAAPDQIRYSFAPLVKRIAPAVVNVYAAREQKRSAMMRDPFFRRFFDMPDPRGRSRERMQRSLGSGVIVSTEGLVITNVHVIEGADEVKVALNDGREYAADILLQDKPSDLAVLKVRGVENMPFVEIGNSDTLEVGDLVLAIGNPFGVGQTVTSGIVSGLARSRIGRGDFGFFIQTDASINPGNSGGALVAMDGSLIGINTAIFTRSGGSNGIGFAVPSNMVRVVVGSANKGRDTLARPFIGASFQPVTAEVAEALGMARPFGALVAEVFDTSPAGDAGLRAGDVVLALDDRPIEHVDALGYRLAVAGTDREVELTVLSQGERRSIAIRLEEGEAPKTREALIEGTSPFAGAFVTQVDGFNAANLRMPRNAEGVVVTRIDRRGPAARAGLRPGDIVVAVNGVAIENVETLVAASKDDPLFWRITLNRRGNILRFVIR